MGWAEVADLYPVIITLHHQPFRDLPPAHIFVDSKLKTRRQGENVVLDLGFTVKVPFGSDVDTHRIDISSQRHSSSNKHIWWLHGPLRLCNDNPDSLMKTHYEGRSGFKEISVSGFPESGEICWNYFKGDTDKVAAQNRLDMLDWTRVECCRVRNKRKGCEPQNAN